MHKLMTLAALALVPLACNSLGTAEDQSTATSLWQRMQGYQDWGQYSGFGGTQEGRSVHGKFVRVYANDQALADEGQPGYGSILVKEGFDSADRSTLRGITVMERIAGYDPDSHDWFFARYDKQGKLTDSGKVAKCADCHFDAGGDDFLFVND